MPKFAANLSMMYQDIGFLDRFDAAARAGFKGVEFLFPYDHPPETIGFAGWIGCEYRPKGDTVAGLGWARKYGIG